jgi:prepilin-type N-terminal cleavage/methylation domain-containing protein
MGRPVEGNQPVLKHITQSKEWSEKGTAEKGFTLVELLVVIAILGILAVVGVLAFGGLTDSAENAVDETEEAQIQTAIDAYLALDPSNTIADGALDLEALETAGVIKEADDISCEYVITDREITTQTCPA